MRDIVIERLKSIQRANLPCYSSDRLRWNKAHAAGVIIYERQVRLNVSPRNIPFLYGMPDGLTSHLRRALACARNSKFNAGEIS